MLGEPNEFLELTEQNTREISLKPFENNIRFSYTQPIFRQTPKFSYQLEGFEKEWSEWKTDYSQVYHNLPPGKYTFKVKSQLSTASVNFPFTIQVWWYQTGWAAGISLLLLSGIAWLQLKLHKSRLTKQRLKLQKEAESQLEEQRLKARNERLQLDVLNKSKELANSTFSLVQKNEILLQIKEDLKSLKKATGTTISNKEYKNLITNQSRELPKIS